MQQRWQDWVGLIFGLVLFLSPWIIGFSGVPTAASSAWVIGVVTVVLFAVALFQPEYRWEEWVNFLLAIALVIAPYLLGFVYVIGAAYTHWLLGVLIGTDAIWALIDRHAQAHAHGAA